MFCRPRFLHDIKFKRKFFVIHLIFFRRIRPAAARADSRNLIIHTYIGAAVLYKLIRMRSLSQRFGGILRHVKFKLSV